MIINFYNTFNFVASIFSFICCVWTEKWLDVNKENKKMIKWAKFRKMIEINGTFVNFMIKSTLGFIGNNINMFILFNCIKLYFHISLLF